MPSYLSLQFIQFLDFFFKQLNEPLIVLREDITSSIYQNIFTMIIRHTAVTLNKIVSAEHIRFNR